MKKILLVPASVLLVNVSAYAQEVAKPGPAGFNKVQFAKQYHFK
jgi:hypothetical protein